MLPPAPELNVVHLQARSWPLIPAQLCWNLIPTHTNLVPCSSDCPRHPRHSPSGMPKWRSCSRTEGWLLLEIRKLRRMDQPASPTMPLQLLATINISESAARPALATTVPSHESCTHSNDQQSLQTPGLSALNAPPSGIHRHLGAAAASAGEPQREVVSCQ